MLMLMLVLAPQWSHQSIQWVCYTPVRVQVSPLMAGLLPEPIYALNPPFKDVLFFITVERLLPASRQKEAAMTKLMASQVSI
ncbi:hypothetical protein ACH42_10160 [Endozoicomonas sp. (ex Bugula neritina AB1)]|nr:hypothetical protein ACH42_10160 [Endozoicomonas sp. (ex Bugula neritina AB1)]